MTETYTPKWVKEQKKKALELMKPSFLYSYSKLQELTGLGYAEVQFLMLELAEKRKVVYRAVFEPNPRAPQGYWLKERDG